MKTIEELLEYGGPKMSKSEYMALKKKKVTEDDFEPHMMYDPKTGKGYKAENPEDHERMKKMGYSHDKPEIKEDVSTAIFGSLLLGLAPFYVLVAKSMADDLKQLKAKSAKKGFKPSKEDQSLLQKFIAMVKRKKPDAVSKAMKKANESVELDEAFQQFLDKSPSNWGEDKVVAYGEKKGHKVIGVVGTGKVDGIVLFGLDAGDKKYVGKEAKVKTGQTVFRYATRNSMAGDLFPLIKIDVKRGLMYHLTQASSSGDIDHAEFESRSVKLKYLRFAATANLRDVTGFDPGFGSMKENTGFDLDTHMENARAKRDAMSAMGKRGKDSADIDMDATDDDRKAASKNVLMQIRKLSDLPKGGEIEFEGGKKGKISQDDADKVVKMFNTLKKPQDKAKFQKVISKDLKTIQSLVKRLGR